MAREQRLAEVFVELAESPMDELDVADVLQRLSERCVELLNISAAGIMLADPHGRLQTVAASDERTRLLGHFAGLQVEGPCVDCYRSGQARLNIDLSSPVAHTAWPRFAGRARSLGFTATEALPVRQRTRVVGALNLFHDRPGTLTRSDSALAQAMADVATIAIVQQRSLERSRLERTQLQAALSSRVVIEQAKGILAGRLQISVDEAFAALRSHARSRQLRLADVA